MDSRDVSTGSATPLSDAIADAGTALAIEGGASKEAGASIAGTLSHKSEKREAGITGGISQKQGWSFRGFFKRVWK